MTLTNELREANAWIERLELRPHPEGGWFRESYRAAEAIPSSGLPIRFTGKRSFSTAIYFLLQADQFSALHRIKSDELWFFHAGSALAIHSITPGGEHHTSTLGKNPERNQHLQIAIPAGTWFGAHPTGPESFTLVSCTVAPGFDFADFELGSRQSLVSLYPQHRTIIEQLTR